MIRKTKPCLYARWGLILLLSAGFAACAPGPSAVIATNVPPTETPAATLTPLALPSPTSPPAVEPAQAQVDTGWQGEYFNNETWQGPATFTRVDPDTVFDWGAGSPAPDFPVDAFTVRWTRCLSLEERYYIFTATADDYVKVLVDDVMVLDMPAYDYVDMPFAVSAGEHCIKVEYREYIGGATVSVAFRPGEALMSSADASTAWQAEYFNNKDFQGPATYTRNDPAPQFDWQLGNAAPGMPIDNFSVRWTRCLDMEGRDYVFTAHADEFVRVLLDDVPVLEAPVSVNAETPVTVTAGNHCIKVEYRDELNEANVFFDFQ